MGLASSLLKAMKPSMAGEYSRELSIKIHDAKIRLAEDGLPARQLSTLRDEETD